MAIFAVNEKDVEKKKSGRGYTKWLHVSPGRIRSGDDDSSLGTGYGYPGA